MNSRATKPKPTVHMAMNTLLRQLATFRKNNSNKLATIIKYQEELGPEWTTKVLASLDDIIWKFQRLRQALEAGRNPDKKSPALKPGFVV